MTERATTKNVELSIGVSSEVALVRPTLLPEFSPPATIHEMYDMAEWEGRWGVDDKKEDFLKLVVDAGDALRRPNGEDGVQTAEVLIERYNRLQLLRLAPITLRTQELVEHFAGSSALDDLNSSIASYTGKADDFRVMLREKLLAVIGRFVESVEVGEPEFVRRSINNCLEQLWKAGLIYGEFAKPHLEKAILAVDSLRPSGLPDDRQRDMDFSREISSHSLPRFISTANKACDALADDAAGWVRFFGAASVTALIEVSAEVQVGEIAAGQVRVPIWLGIVRGVHECKTGVQIGIWTEQPSKFYTAALAKVQFNFVDDKTLLVANVQSKSLETYHSELRYYRDIEQYSSLKATMPPFLSQIGNLSYFSKAGQVDQGTFLRDVKYAIRTELGLKSELDAMLFAAVGLAKECGFTTLLGIDDDAQSAFLHSNERQTRAKVYAPRFARFGFKPPTEDAPFWKLDVTSLELHTGADVIVPASLNDYASLVRARRISSDKVDYESWKVSKRADLDTSLRISKGILAPAAACGRAIASKR